MIFVGLLLPLTVASIAAASTPSVGRNCTRAELGRQRATAGVTLRCAVQRGRRQWVVVDTKQTPTSTPRTPTAPTPTPTPTPTPEPNSAATTNAPGTPKAPTTIAAPPPSSTPTVANVPGPQVNVADRSFIVHHPNGSRPRVPGPLVVVLHGGLGGAEQAQSAYGWDAVADRNGFTVLYPEGLPIAIGHAWNAGSCCALPAALGVDDVGFISAIIDTLVNAKVADPKNVFATGMSNGAMLTYRLACDRPGRFAAIGPVAGTITSDCPTPAPISVLHIHGEADANVPFDGSATTKGTTAGTVRMSVPTALERFRTAAKCPVPTTSTAGPVTRQSSSCPGGIDVNLITIAGAGHQWPGSPVQPTAAAAAIGVDPPSQALDATAQLWDFFAAHRR